MLSCEDSSMDRDLHTPKHHLKRWLVTLLLNIMEITEVFKMKNQSFWVMGLTWERDTEIWEICIWFALQQLRATTAGRNVSVGWWEFEDHGRYDVLQWERASEHHPTLAVTLTRSSGLSDCLSSPGLFPYSNELQERDLHTATNGCLIH